MTWLRRALLATLLGAVAGCGTTPAPTATEWRGDPSASRVTIRGLISMPRSGGPTLVDCTNNKVSYALGGMSAGNFLYLKRRVGELSRRAPEPVTAEISGYVRKVAGGYRIERPGLMYVASGRCVEMDDASLDYR